MMVVKLKNLETLKTVAPTVEQIANGVLGGTAQEQLKVAQANVAYEFYKGVEVKPFVYDEHGQLI